jgi:calcineurin-like phosphoesterase family protein
MPDLGSVRLLHISDIHYGKKANGGSAHHFVRTRNGRATPEPQRLAKILFDDPDLLQSPDAVVVSGDLGWSGVADDYKHATELLTLLRERWPVPLVLCPGNHDVNFAAKDLLSGQEEFVEGVLKKLYQEDELRRLFPFSIFGGSFKLIEREKLVSFTTVGKSLLVVAVNSAAHLPVESDAHGKPKIVETPIYISPDLLEEIGQYIDRTGELAALPLRLFVMHHHLFPFAEPEPGDVVDYAKLANEPDKTMVANSAQMQAWLARNRFSLILHGHKHMPHGREDILWRREDPTIGRALTVIGAGSGGVERHNIPPGEHLSYNIIRLDRIDKERWKCTVCVSKISPNEPGKKSKRDFTYSTEVGEPLERPPAVFVAHQMDDCYRAIKDRCNEKVEIRNFVSVVKNSDYEHPSIAGKSKAEVVKTFRVLHPEYIDGARWLDADAVHAKLAKTPRRFEFQHGPRLFGMPGFSDRTGIQPVRNALNAITTRTRAYTSLLSPEIDLFPDEELEQPMPALVGIQFLPNGRLLDIVGIFRNLELSYWWLVNMYELGELLRWACEDKRMVCGSVTMFASFAHWDSDPYQTVPTEIDEMPLRRLAGCAADFAMNASAAELLGLLIEKKKHTNQYELETIGLERLAELLEYHSERKNHDFDGFIGLVRDAVEHIQTAIDKPKERAAKVRLALDLLQRAIDSIEHR